MKGVLGSEQEPPQIREARKILFRALLNHRRFYANGPWWAWWQDGPWRYRGTLTIAHDRVPIWTLQYMGDLPLEVHPCLHAALEDSARRKEFQGGRGTPDLAHNGYLYKNRWGHPSYPGMNGCNFVQGREEVFNLDGQLRGWASYHAQLIL